MEIGDESARLSALRDVGMLDAEPDPALDRLARLAGELLGVPISLVTLVADGRQYIPGATGLTWGAACRSICWPLFPEAASSF